MDPQSSMALDQQLCFALYAATRAMMRAYAPALEKLGITYPQYLVLLVLWEQTAPLAVKALGERLDLDSGTLSPLLKRLEAQGLVTRTRDLADERVVLLAVTPEGLRLRERALDLPVTMACSVGLPLAELTRMRSDLRRLHQALRALEPPGASRHQPLAEAEAGTARARTPSRSSTRSPRSPRSTR